MGGANSEVSATTTMIALESAYFEPTSVRRTSKRLGLKTEASIRFERGGDIDTPPTGIARAAELFAQHRRRGAVDGRSSIAIPCRASRGRSSCDRRRIARLLGQDVPAVGRSAVPRAARVRRRSTRATPSELDGNGADLPRRRHPRRGSDRGSRAALRLRSAARSFSAAGAPHRRRRIRGSRAIGSSARRSRRPDSPSR